MLVRYFAGKTHALRNDQKLMSHHSPNVAPSLGPILGGVLAGHPGWPWIFWFLVILSGFCLTILFLFLPETARTIVGNGGFPTNHVLNICPPWSRKNHLPEGSDHVSQPRRFRLPNPLKCLVLLSRKDTVLIVTINGIYYSTYCCVQASLALLFIEIYRFNEIQAGLIYLPFGIGCALASFISGRKAYFLSQELPLISTREDYGQRLSLNCKAIPLSRGSCQRR